MTGKELPAETPPRFCTRDGMTLVDKRSEIRMGFDPMTGLERPRVEHVTRECPTPDHDVWVYSDLPEREPKWIRL